jgi:hypothetical protein
MALEVFAGEVWITETPTVLRKIPVFPPVSLRVMVRLSLVMVLEIWACTVSWTTGSRFWSASITVTKI